MFMLCEECLMSGHDLCDETALPNDTLSRLAAIVGETTIDSGALTVTNPRACAVAGPQDLEGMLRRFHLGQIMPYGTAPDSGSLTQREASATRAASRAIRRALASSYGVDYSMLYDAADIPVLALGQTTVFCANDDPGKDAIEEILGVLRFSRRVQAVFAYARHIETTIGALQPARDIDREAILELRAALKHTLERATTLIEGGMRFDAKQQFVRAERFLAALRIAVRDEMICHQGAKEQ